MFAASSGNKQPAQERLKRLQTNLKYSSSKKYDKERISPQKKSRRNSQTASAHASTAQQQQQQQKVQQQKHQHFQRRRSQTPTDTPKQAKCYEEKSPKYRSSEKSRTAQYSEPIATASASSHSSRYSSRSSHRQPGSGNFVELKNAWAKPKALLDASNRLDAGSRTISGR